MIDPHTPNVDPDVSTGFGREWATFRQSASDLTDAEREQIFSNYFRIFPWHKISTQSVVADIGCGSGRWSVLIASRVGHLHLIDASAEALAVARENLAKAANVSFHLASVGDLPLPAASLDFAFSLGVLHHVPDTEGALAAIASRLKSGAPFLVYLYYAFDNRPRWYRAIWRASDYLRIVIARLPHAIRLLLSQIIAALGYWPLARAAMLFDRIGLAVKSLPLSWYRDKSFYVMRTDAYDRFCTKLEKRFTRREIEAMLSKAGFCDIRFSENEPYWCAIAIKH